VKAQYRQRQSFLTSAADASEESTSLLSLLTPREYTPIPIVSKAGWVPTAYLDNLGKKKIFYPLWDLNPGLSSYTDCGQTSKHALVYY
jgi:hypothetical protein